MNSALQHALGNNSGPDAQAALAEARAYLDGHSHLENKFDAIFKGVDNDTVALAEGIAANPAA
jgi:hypothetical protein